MNADFLAGIVRILGPDGQTAGTGFVITSTGVMLTCAHVLQSISSQQRGEPHPDEIKIEFYQNKHATTARVIEGGWRASDQEDMAVLQVESPVGQTFSPLILGIFETHQIAHFRSFGFPVAENIDGIHASGQIKGFANEAEHLIMQLHSSELAPGHSGAPVIEQSSGQIVGMVVSVFETTGKLRDTAFAIPTQTIFQIWPELAYLAGSDSTASKTAATIVPFPPAPDLVHHLSIHASFTGRRSERQILTNWFSSGTEPVLALTAIGGMGKSALARVWVVHDVLHRTLPGVAYQDKTAGSRLLDQSQPDGVLWWSFDAPEASFGKFLGEAITYTSSGSANPDTIQYTFDKVRLLLQLLARGRFLIILDGLEKQLCAYAALNAAYQGDSFETDTQQGYRACNDPHLADFLARFAESDFSSRLLITSRLFPNELENLAGCRHEELVALTPEDIVEFFRMRNIQANQAEIKRLGQVTGYHPLTLNLVAGLIIKDSQHSMDIRVANDWLTSSNVQNEIDHILRLSFQALKQSEQKLLSVIAAFRSPIDYATILAVSPFDEGQLRLALVELRERGLLEFDPKTRLHHLHPIVRHYAYDRLLDKTAVHSRLHTYYSVVPVPDANSIRSLSDLDPVIELYHHTLNAGLIDQAAEIYISRLRYSLYYRLGDYVTDLELLNSMPKSHDDLPNITLPRYRGWWFIYKAMDFERTGSPIQGRDLLQKVIQFSRKIQDVEMLASALVPYSMLCCDMGSIAEAEHAIRESVDIFVKIGNANWEGISHRSLGRVLLWKGEYVLASNEFDLAQKAYGTGSSFIHGRSVLLIYRSLLALWQDKPQEAFHFAQEASRLSISGDLKREEIKSTWLLGASTLQLGQADSVKYLEAAHTQCRKVSLVEIESDILLTLAQWYRQTGDLGCSEKYALDALNIAARCHYRTREADAEIILAALNLDQGNTVAARQHARKAYDLAWCDGPSHSYFYGLSKLQTVMTKFGLYGYYKGLL